MSVCSAHAHVAREPSPRYLVGGAAQGEQALTRAFDLLATAPGGVAKLRELILSLAVTGRLVKQDPRDLARRELLAKMRAGAEKPSVDLVDSKVVARPYPIPDGWTWLSLGDVAVISGGVTLGRKTAPLNPVTLPYLRVANVQRWSLSLASLKEITIDQSELGKYQLKPGDLLVTEGGDWDKVGRTCTWRNELPVCAHQNHVFKVRGPTMDWVPAWAELYLNGPVARAYFAGAAKQTTNLASINMRQLKACPFPFPPLAEQHRIVARVEELMRLCDALEAKGQLADAQHARLVSTLFDALTRSQSPQELAEHWQRISAHFDLLLDRPEALDALEQTILQLAVRGLLVPQDPRDEPASELLACIRAEKDKLIADGKIKREKRQPDEVLDDAPFEAPHGWVWEHFATVIEIASNLVKPKDFLDLPQVAPDCIEKGTGRLIEFRTVRDAQVISANHFFRSGQILYSKIRPSLSKAALVDFDGLCSADMYPLNCKINREFSLLYILSQDFLAQVKQAENRVKMPKLNQEALNMFVVPVPPLAEQHRIVTRVQQLRALCAQLRERSQAARAIQSRLAQALVEQAAA